MLDIFSRKAICWEAHYGESGDLAKAFMQHAIAANGGARPRYIVSLRKSRERACR